VTQMVDTKVGPGNTRLVQQACGAYCLAARYVDIIIMRWHGNLKCPKIFGLVKM